MTDNVLVNAFASAAESTDGTRLANLFTEDGVYHDGFYGAFQGRAAITSFLEGHVYRDCKDMVWTFEDVVQSEAMIYAKYLFSYTSTLKGCEGKRVVFEGISQMKLRADQIERYSEVFDRGLGLAQLDFAPERIARFLRRTNETVLAAAPQVHRTGR